VLAGLLNFWTRKQYGQEMEPMLAMLHNRRVTISVARFEMGVAKWSKLGDNLTELVSLAVASQIGCSWCMDFGYFAAHSKGQSVEKLAEVPRWRESDVFTPLERDVIAFAEAMTATPPEVTDAMVDGLVAGLGVPAVVELTKMVAVENERSRFNSALGLTSQGFSDRCELAPPR
jgi:AhpD family alkylhydroperoxidase